MRPGSRGCFTLGTLILELWLSNSICISPPAAVQLSKVYYQVFHGFYSLNAHEVNSGVGGIEYFDASRLATRILSAFRLLVGPNVFPSVHKIDEKTFLGRNEFQRHGNLELR